VLHARLRVRPASWRRLDGPHLAQRVTQAPHQLQRTLPVTRERARCQLGQRLLQGLQVPQHLRTSLGLHALRAALRWRVGPCLQLVEQRQGAARARSCLRAMRLCCSTTSGSCLRAAHELAQAGLHVQQQVAKLRVQARGALRLAALQP
jgi:hypothetical protein